MWSYSIVCHLRLLWPAKFWMYFLCEQLINIVLKKKKKKNSTPCLGRMCEEPDQQPLAECKILIFFTQLRNNIPCHLTDISCGLRCNQLLKCAMHKCKRICHKGECLIDEDCKQPCTYPRPDCGHPCLATCHPSQPCPSTACSAMVIVLLLL